MHYFAALNRLDRLSPQRFLTMLSLCGQSAEAMWHAPRKAWLQAGIEDSIVSDILTQREKIDPPAELAKLEKIGATVLPITDPHYPERLRTISSPPPVLLIRGTFPCPADTDAIAVVGSRITTTYGRQVTQDISSDLARQGFVIISGLARGVDAFAHQAALSAGARTIAVLGCGIDRIYPAEHTTLAADIIATGGALISEFPIGTPPNSYNFPRRNRIVAALSRGVLVTEAREKSGALITAELALSMGRDVLVVPGNINSPQSIGANNLFKQGATPVFSAADVTNTLNLYGSHSAVPTPAPTSATEATLFAILTRQPQEIEDLIRKSNLPSHEVLSSLSLMELTGHARNVGPTVWVRNA